MLFMQLSLLPFITCKNTYQFSIKILQQFNSLIVHVEMLSCTEFGTLDGCHLLAVHWSVQAGRQLRGCHPLYKPIRKKTYLKLWPITIILQISFMIQNSTFHFHHLVEQNKFLINAVCLIYS